MNLVHRKRQDKPHSEETRRACPSSQPHAPGLFCFFYEHRILSYTWCQQAHSTLPTAWQSASCESSLQRRSPKETTKNRPSPKHEMPEYDVPAITMMIQEDQYTVLYVCTYCTYTHHSHLVAQQQQEVYICSSYLQREARKQMLGGCARKNKRRGWVGGWVFLRSQITSSSVRERKVQQGHFFTRFFTERKKRKTSALAV